MASKYAAILYPVTSLPPLSVGAAQERVIRPDPTSANVGATLLTNGATGGAVVAVGAVSTTVLFPGRVAVVKVDSPAVPTFVNNVQSLTLVCIAALVDPASEAVTPVILTSMVMPTVAKRRP